jgi:hypothetical protein
MAFKTILEIGDKKYRVLDVSYALSRSVDIKGRPASTIYGGSLNISLESTADTTILESMLNNEHKPIDGKITIYKDAEESSLKVITFTTGYVTSFAEYFSAAGGAPMTYSVTITAEILAIGAAEHDNKWPADDDSNTED